MEVQKTLDILHNTFINSKDNHHKNLALQQKFIYVLYKKESIDYHIKYKLYLEALLLLNQSLYKDSFNHLKDYIMYFESLF
jgi:hypothetical protein